MTGKKAAAYAFKAEVTKRGDAFAAVDHAEREPGSFDTIVNNACIASIQPLAYARPAGIDKIAKPNVQAAAKNLKQRKQRGKIISASSIACHQPPRSWACTRQSSSPSEP